MIDQSQFQSARILSAVSLSSIGRFYCEALGLPVNKATDREFECRTGDGELHFAKSIGSTIPLYHFAFNIAENKIDAARDWLAERVELIDTPPEFRDPAHAPEVRWFKSWNAHALYFLDPAGNVVECIARHDLPSGADGPFTPADILGISEIALAADDTLALANWIYDVTGFEPYKDQSETFRPMGDERGMFVIFKTGTKLIGGITAQPAPVKVTVRGAKPGVHKSPRHPYEIEVIE